MWVPGAEIAGALDQIEKAYASPTESQKNDSHNLDSNLSYALKLCNSS